MRELFFVNFKHKTKESQRSCTNRLLFFLMLTSKKLYFLYVMCARTRFVNLCVIIKRSSYVVILSKSWKGLGLVSTPHNRPKIKREMFAISYRNMWATATLILPEKHSKVLNWGLWIFQKYKNLIVLTLNFFFLRIIFIHSIWRGMIWQK